MQISWMSISKRQCQTANLSSFTSVALCLHWLCVPECISFKLAVLIYRAIHGTAPTYLQSCFTHLADMTSRQRLQSSASQRLAVPPVRRTTVGKRAFPVSEANVWNNLPSHITSAQSLVIFRQHLETFIFTKSYPDIHIWLITHLTHIWLSPRGLCNN